VAGFLPTLTTANIHRFRLKEAKIVEHFAVRDDLGMFQQLGHLSAIGEQMGLRRGERWE